MKKLVTKHRKGVRNLGIIASKQIVTKEETNRHKREDRVQTNDSDKVEQSETAQGREGQQRQQQSSQN